jgi:tetratricopeptide (TPR) repeat protein
MIAALNNTRGRYEEARTAAEAALEVAREARDRLFEGSALSHLGDAHAGLGQFDAAAASYREAQTVFAEIQDTMRQQETSLKLARLDLRQGAGAQARRVAREILEQARAGGYPPVEIEALETLGEIEAHEGRRSAAQEHYSAALTRARETGDSGRVLDLSVRLVQLLMEDRRLDDAATVLGLLNDPPEFAPLLKVRAQYAYLRGEHEQARSYMQRAKELDRQAWSEEDEETFALYAR